MAVSSHDSPQLRSRAAGGFPAAVIRYQEAASVGQRMLWLVEQVQGRRGQLNYPLLLRIRGELDRARLESAVARLVERHEALRTSFARRGGTLTQLIHEPAPVPVTVAPADTAGPHHAVDGWLADTYREAALPIDPAGSPIRVTLRALGERDHVLCVNVHHLVTDAWSCRVLTEELHHLLTSPAPLPRVGWQYRHFVRWQRRPSTVRRLRAEQSYWRGQLAGARPVTLPEPAAGSGHPADHRTIRVRFDRDVADRLRESARAEQTTLFAVLLSAFYAVLHEVTGQHDLTVAAPFANRTHPEVMRSVGFFANLLALRARLPRRGGFPELLRQVKRIVGEAISHQGVAYYSLPGGTAPGAGGAVGRMGIGNVVFQMLPALPPPAAAGSVRLEVLPSFVSGRFDLDVTLVPDNTGITALMQYALDRIAEDAAERIANTYLTSVRTAAGSATR